MKFKEMKYDEAAELYETGLPRTRPLNSAWDEKGWPVIYLTTKDNAKLTPVPRQTGPRLDADDRAIRKKARSKWPWPMRILIPRPVWAKPIAANRRNGPGCSSNAC